MEHKKQKPSDMFPEVMGYPEMMDWEAKRKQDGIIRKCANMNNPEMMNYESMNDGKFPEIRKLGHPEIVPNRTYCWVSVSTEKRPGSKSPWPAKTVGRRNNPEMTEYE